jgi:hypothetical protein
MIEPKIEATDEELRESGDELSDEALDRRERTQFLCLTKWCETGGN